MRYPSRRWLLPALMVVLIGMLSGCGGGGGTTLTVNSNNNYDDGVCNASHCSLHEAIDKANTLTGTTTINFNIGGGGPQIIYTDYPPLPTITSTVAIDGRSQPGYVSHPLIELRGYWDIESSGEGLVLAGGDSTVLGVAINGHRNGIVLQNKGNNLIQGCYIGTDAIGMPAYPNIYSGVWIKSGSGNIIGGTSPEERNIISGNTGYGIMIQGDGNTVIGNYIGVDAAGGAALPNGAGGILVKTQTNVIGGVPDEGGNVISGNEGNGVYITGHEVEVKGNHIGVDRYGTAALGNGMNGLFISGTGDALIGGAQTAGRNIISANGMAGISINFETSGVSVFGNYIGTNKSGTAALGNVQAGIHLWGDDLQIGSSQVGTGNLISGNLGPGIMVNGGAKGIAIQNNFIGTDVNGTAALGNAKGIEVSAGSSLTDVTIGGTSEGEGNLISGNDGEGLLLSNGATVLGNLIGTVFNGLAPLGNGADGILIQGPGNEVGGTGLPNTIAYNGGHGVAVISGNGGATGNPIPSNAIYENSGLGIAIDEDAVIPNDFQDPDDGDNNRQNYPVLQSAVVGPTAIELTVSGILNSTPGSTFTVEFFINDACDPSGYGEGRRPVKKIVVATDSNGNATLTAVLPGLTLGAAGFVTATATDAAGNTSGFSTCIPYMEESAAPEPEGMSFSPFIDPAEIFFGRGCAPNQVRIGVEIADPPEPVSYVLLFARLFDPKTEAKSGWSDGLNMQASGENKYFYDLLAEDVPEYPDFPDAVLQYQFVAYNKAREVIGRSEVYGGILFKRCG
jgi:hypothetical protein